MNNTSTSAATPQPPPQPGQDIVYKRVLADIQTRVEAGYVKYGIHLQTHNGRDALVDAYQEAIDLVMYLAQMLMERESQPTTNRDNHEKTQTLGA